MTQGILRHSWTRLEDILLSNNKLMNKRIEILGLISSDKTYRRNSDEATEHIDVRVNTDLLDLNNRRN